MGVSDDGLARLGVGVADHDHLGVKQRRLGRVAQELVQVRDLALDEFLVLAQQLAQLDVAVEDAHLEALAHQLLGQRHQGRIAHVVGAGLEGQAEQRHAAAAFAGDQAVGGLDVRLIAVEQAGNRRHGHFAITRQRQEALDLLGQA